MLLLLKNNSYLFVYFTVLQTYFVNVSPYLNTLSNLAEKFTTLKKCVLDVHLFSDALTASGNNRHVLPKSISRGNDHITFWEDFLTHLVTFNGENSFVIENESSLNKSTFSTVFSSETFKPGDNFNYFPAVPGIELVSNFRFFNHACSKCAVTILLNYDSYRSVWKRIFLQQRNPFILRGSVNWGTVLLTSFESPYFHLHGITNDLAGSGRIFYLHVILMEEIKGKEDTRFAHVRILPKFAEQTQPYRKTTYNFLENFQLGRFLDRVHFRIYFHCAYCPPEFFLQISLSKTNRFQLDLFLFQNLWNFRDVKFTSNKEVDVAAFQMQGIHVSEFCKSSMRVRHAFACSTAARKMATLESLINISFVNEKNSGHKWWGGVIFTTFRTNIDAQNLNRLSYQYEQG